ncbi:MAG: hypothetical protein EZS28_034603 [Streblomastix strix]|uniref:Tyr recombinase domain-containing protein n=1 Tax=Streblomastix strix TaxID=222440 RepID=A0A5J4UIQ4_9EUKA|nr:MAG: hypothetical protein EZS28_034603 [Streblomastix strix]
MGGIQFINKKLGSYLMLLIVLIRLRAEKILRASAEKTDGGNWQLHIQIIKVKGYNATLTFRPLADLNMCPTFWLQQWFQRRKRKDKDKPLWFIFQKNRHATYDECSKATHLIMKQTGIKDYPPVTSIRKSLMTKAIDQGANKQQINRFSRYKQGSIIVQTNYDMNLNDTIRQRLAKL